MANKKVTDLTELTSAADDDLIYIVDVSDTTGSSNGTGKKIQKSNLVTGGAGSGTVTSVDITAGTGISSTGGPITTSGSITVGLAADINDLDDVNAGSPSNDDVLSYDTATSKYIADGRLTTLYDEFRTGTTTDVQNGASTDSKLELTSTTAKMKTGVTEVKLTETSPGEIDFVVAAGASGSETAFTAVEINGTTTANTAHFDVNTGTRLRIESTTNDFATVRNQASADTTIDLPTSTGTLALTSELYTDSDADARIAAANVTDLSDVTSAGSGAIITSAERTKLSGIATGAEVNVQSDWNATSGDALILNKPTIPSNTNLANTNLTADDNRTYDADGNTLTIDINGGDFALSDSSSSDTYIQAGTNLLELGDGAMTVQATGKFYADAGIEHDEAGLTVAGAYGAGSEITYLGSASTATTTGRIYYYNGTTWTAYTSATEAPQKALLGIALGTTMAKGFLIKGFVNPNGATGFTAASPVYGATNSSATTTAPTTGFQRVMGNSISTSVIFFNPSSEYIELT